MMAKWVCGTVVCCWAMSCFVVMRFGHWDWDIRSREESFKRAKFFASPPPPSDDRTGTICPAPFPPRCPGEGTNGWESCDPNELPDFEIEIRPARPQKDFPPVLPSEQQQRKDFHDWLEKKERQKEPGRPAPSFEWQHDFPKA